MYKNVFKITSDKEVSTVSSLMNNQSGENICIAIDKAYGRGLNIKFAKEANVIVVCNNPNNGIIHYTEAA